MFHSRDEEYELIAAAKAGALAAARISAGHPAPFDPERAEIGLSARNELVETNLRFIWSLCNRHVKRIDRFRSGSEFLSLAFEGYIHAIELFDFSLGNRLNTYAEKWIRNYLWNRDIESPKTIKAGGGSKFFEINEHAETDAFIVRDEPVLVRQEVIEDRVNDAIESLPIERDKEIVRMKMDGLTDYEVADRYGVSHQRVNAIFNRSKERLALKLRDLSSWASS